MDTSQILSQMLILFAVISLGFIATKAGLFNAESRLHLSNLALCVANPCTALYSVLGTEQLLSKQEVLQLSGITLAFYVLIILLARLVPKLLRTTREEAGVYQFMTIFSNVGFMGYPVVRAVYGSGAMFHATIFNVFFQLLSFTYGIRLISTHKEDARFSWRILARPMVIASIVSYVLYFADVQPVLQGHAAGRVLIQVLGFVDGITSPLCMVVIGISLALVPVKKVFTNWRLYALVVFKQILLPVVMYFVLRPFVSKELILGICVIMTAMPIAAMTSLFCAKYDGPCDTAAAGVFLSTLLSVPAIPLVMLMLFH